MCDFTRLRHLGHPAEIYVLLGLKRANATTEEFSAIRARCLSFREPQRLPSYLRKTAVYLRRASTIRNGLLRRPATIKLVTARVNTVRDDLRVTKIRPHRPGLRKGSLTHEVKSVLLTPSSESGTSCWAGGGQILFTTNVCLESQLWLRL